MHSTYYHAFIVKWVQFWGICPVFIYFLGITYVTHKPAMHAPTNEIDEF